MIDLNKDKTSLLVSVNFHYLNNSQVIKKKPLKTGMRMLMWYDNNFSESTSVHFITKKDITIGNQVEIRIVILSPINLKKNLKKGALFNLGINGKVIGLAEIIELIGYWDDLFPNEKLPVD